MSTIVDIRSDRHAPEAPDFDRANVEIFSAKAGLGYRWMGRVFEHVQDAVAEAAVDDLIAIASVSNSVILCRDADPERCRRSTLFAPALLARGIGVLHVLPDGSLRHHESPLPFDR